MASTKTTVVSSLLSLLVFTAACDDSVDSPQAADSVDDDSPEEMDLQEQDEEALPLVALSSESREKLVAQFDARGLDRSGIDSCGEAGLLAAVTDPDGRHFTFCGDGAVLQVVPAEIGQLFQFSSDDLLERIQEVVPAGQEIPEEVKAYIQAGTYGGLADPVIATSDYVRSENPPPVTEDYCPNVQSWCDYMTAWGKDLSDNNDFSKSMSWCFNSNNPQTRSTRTFSKQIKYAKSYMATRGYIYGGKAFVQACEDDTVKLRGYIKCYETGKWKRLYKRTVNGNEIGSIELSSSDSKGKNCSFADDLRFTVRGGKFVGGGAYRDYLITF